MSKTLDDWYDEEIDPPGSYAVETNHEVCHPLAQHVSAANTMKRKSSALPSSDWALVLKETEDVIATILPIIIITWAVAEVYFYKSL